MCPAEPVRQSSTNILDVLKDVSGCLSRSLDKIPERLGACMGWCVVKVLKVLGWEEVEEWK